MQINIKEMNRQWQEKLPPDYTVTHRLQKSLLTHEYLVICRTEDNGTAFVYFDGISETPIMIDKYYDKPTPITNEDNLK